MFVVCRDPSFVYKLDQNDEVSYLYFCNDMFFVCLQLLKHTFTYVTYIVSFKYCIEFVGSSYMANI